MGGEVVETHEETSKTATDDTADGEAVKAEGDVEDPETEVARREGPN